MVSWLIEAPLRLAAVARVLLVALLAATAACAPATVSASGGRSERGRSLPRHPAGAHVPLLLGIGEPQQRAGPGPLAEPVLLEHRRRRLRPDRVSGRRRARLRHARSRRGERTLVDPALLLERAAGTGAHRRTGYRGFFYHFLDMETGHRYQTTSSSPPSTPRCSSPACCRGRVLRPDRLPTSRRSATLADALYRRVEWKWFQVAVARWSPWRWRPEEGLLPAEYKGYDEAMILYVLALGSPTHPIAPTRLARLHRAPTRWGDVPRPGRTSTSRRCSATSTRTSGSTSAASRTPTCATRGSTTSRTPAARPWRSAPTRSRTRGGGKATIATCGA